jgi:hypothetical protein
VRAPSSLCFTGCSAAPDLARQPRTPQRQLSGASCETQGPADAWPPEDDQASNCVHATLRVTSRAAEFSGSTATLTLSPTSCVQHASAPLSFPARRLGECVDMRWAKIGLYLYIAQATTGVAVGLAIALVHFVSK